MSLETKLACALRKIQSDVPSKFISAGPVDRKPFNYWEVRMKGPDGSPYSGRSFLVGLHFPPNYPESPPKVCFTVGFLTKVYHPNIAPAKNIDFDILRPTGWSLVFTVSEVLMRIFDHMATPNLEAPLVAYAGDMYKTDKATFDLIARMWAGDYAGPV